MRRGVLLAEDDKKRDGSVVVERRAMRGRCRWEVIMVREGEGEGEAVVVTGD